MAAVRLAVGAVLALVAVLAVDKLRWMAAQVAAAWGVGALGLWGAVVVAAGVLAWRGRERAWPRWAPFAALGGLLAIRLAVVAWVDAPLISDFLAYHDLAVGLLGGAPWLQLGRPIGYPWMLAGAYGAVGVDPAVGEGLNVVLGLATGGALWALARRLDVPAGPALALFALWPAHALMTPVLGTEVAYALLFVAIAWALVPATPGWAALAGVFTVLAQHVRPTTLALVPAALAYLWLAGRPRLAAPLAYVATLAVLLAPVMAFNHREIGRWSPSTSAYGGWSLLVGMNQQHGGTWNVDDAAVADRLGDMRAVDGWAREEGWRRLTADPVASARLVARKFPTMWALEDFAPYWSLGTRPQPDDRLIAALNLVCQTFYAAVALLAAWAVWRRRDWGLAWLPLFAGLLTLVGVHCLLEVQSRYHFYWTPVLMLIAARATFSPGQATSPP